MPKLPTIPNAWIKHKTNWSVINLQTLHIGDDCYKTNVGEYQAIVFKPQGSYFIMADWRGVAPTCVKDDVQFARWLTTEVGVASIPPSAFYQESDKYLGRYLTRFAICKRDETLAAAADRLSKLGRL
jgi:aspartate/methionine/tyrosine aminotransferase